MTLRPGSGAYVREVAPSLLDQARALDLLRLVRKHVTIAEEFDLDASRYAEIVLRYTRSRAGATERPDPLVFIECNREQIDMISEELRRRLRARTEPILLSDLLQAGRSTLILAAAARYLVTTDYHFAEVAPVARRLGKKLLCVRLDPRILESMLSFAARGTLGMIVSDPAFLPPFRRSLQRLGLDPSATRRIEAAASKDREKVRALISRADALYVSPLCFADVKGLIPPTMPLLQPRSHLSTESVESIEALLLFGEREPGPKPAPSAAAARTAPAAPEAQPTRRSRR